MRLLEKRLLHEQAMRVFQGEGESLRGLESGGDFAQTLVAAFAPASPRGTGPFAELRQVVVVDAIEQAAGSGFDIRLEEIIGLQEVDRHLVCQPQLLLSRDQFCARGLVQLEQPLAQTVARLRARRIGP